MLPIFNISLIGRVDALGLNSVNWPLGWLQKLTHVSLAIAILLVNLILRWIKPNNRLWVEYNKNYSNNIVTECINVYRATQSMARSLLSCGVRLSVCLSRCCMETAKLTIKLFHRLVRWPRGHPQQGRQIEVGYQKFAIFNQYFRNTDTDTKYRGISKYQYRIPIPTENTDTDPALVWSRLAAVVERFASVEESVEFVDVACRTETRPSWGCIAWPKPFNGRLHAGNLGAYHQTECS